MAYIIGEGYESDVDAQKAQDGQAQDETRGNMMAARRRNDPNKDPMAGQNVVRRPSQDFDESEIEDLLDTSWLAERLVDGYANYATKEGADIHFQSTADEVSKSDLEAAKKSTERFIEEHEAFNVLNEGSRRERATGDAMIIPVLTEAEAQRDTSEELGKVKDIETFNVVGQNYMENVQTNMDPLSAEFGKIQRVDVERFPKGGVQTDSGPAQFTLHPSRFIHIRCRESQNNPNWGLSVFRRIRTLLMTLLNAEWSVGQIIFRAVWKIMKTDLGEYSNQQQINQAEREMERDWGPLTLSLIDTEEELKMESSASNLGGMGDVFSFFKDLLSAGTGYPKSVLFGTQSGTLAASDRDAKNFFQGIEGYQESELTPALVDMIRFGWKAKDGIDNQGIAWEKVEPVIDWNNLFEISKQDRVKMRKTEAQAKTQTVNFWQNMVAGQIVKRETAQQGLVNAGIIPADAELPEKAGAGGMVNLGGSNTPESGEEEPDEEGEGEPDEEGEEQESEPDPSQNGNPAGGRAEAQPR